MFKTIRHIHAFMFSQYLADGARITMAIILPATVCSLFGRLDLGFTISLGALCVSLSDAPGPEEHKRNGMLYCAGFVFGLSLLTGLVSGSIILLGLLIAGAAFFFTMFAVFGARAAGVGTASLLVMILRMDTVQTPTQVVTDSLLILGGGLWYTGVSLFFIKLRPNRPAQRALGDSIYEMAAFLRIKAELYDVNAEVDAAYQKLLTQQVVVTEKQDAVRDLLFRNKEMLSGKNQTGKRLVRCFSDTIDLFEHITATWYDYHSLRQKFTHTGILREVSTLINNIAGELDHIGLAIQTNSPYHKRFDLLPALDQLKSSIDALEPKGSSQLILKKILVNLRNHHRKIEELLVYFEDRVPGQGSKSLDYRRFLTQQEISTNVLVNNLNLNSGIFRHAIRMMLTCSAGYIIAKLMSFSHYSYWILLTIIVILKPGFSLSRQRNLERLTGTIIGGGLGVLIIYYIQDRNVLLALIVVFMVLTYSFMRLNYVVMVIFTTPYVIILFSFMGMGFTEIATERLLDTGIGCGLAFLASYLLFPQWEAKQVDSYVLQVLRSNADYLQKLIALFLGKTISLTEYKLVRKEVNVSSANLSAALQRMIAEPRSKQHRSAEIQQLLVLNHILSSNIAGLTASRVNKAALVYSQPVINSLKEALAGLEKGITQLDKNYIPVNIEESVKADEAIKLPDEQLKDQLNFIKTISNNICKLAKTL